MGDTVAHVATTDTPIDALLFWAASALRCSARIVSNENTSLRSGPESSPTRLTQEIDAAQMLLALRNTLRAAEWLAKNPVSAAAPLIAEFNQMVPDVVQARDALEHFDEYAEGRGHQQQSTPGPYLFVLSGERTEAVATVGPYSINVLRAREACRKLVSKLVAVSEFQGDMYIAEAFLEDFEENG
jgi:hypothetical protein